MEPNPCFKPHSGTTITKDEPSDCEVVFSNVSPCMYNNNIEHIHVLLFLFV